MEHKVKSAESEEKTNLLLLRLFFIRSNIVYMAILLCIVAYCGITSASIAAAIMVVIGIYDATRVRKSIK